MIRAGYISQEVDTFGDRENGIIAFNLQAGFTGLFMNDIPNLPKVFLATRKHQTVVTIPVIVCYCLLIL